MIDQYPSVTRILAATKPQEDIDALERWRKRIGYAEAEKISKAALERGKMYDNFVEDYTNGIDIPHPQLKEYLSQFEIVSREQTIYNNEFGYKGRYDCIFAKNGILILNDFKGSGRKKSRKYLKDYPLQIAAYIKAIEETGVVINWGMISVILSDQIQTFVFDHCEIEKYFTEFITRLKKYNDAKNADF
jgi:genome maintenance exonuclease 1